MSIRTLTLVAVLGLAAVGCSGPDPAPVQKITAITGRVLVGGKPTDRVSLTFHPVTPGQGREESCGSQEGGVYRTELIAAKYKVSFTPTGGANVPRAYRSEATTPVTVEVTGAEMSKDFELK